MQRAYGVSNKLNSWMFRILSTMFILTMLFAPLPASARSLHIDKSSLLPCRDTGIITDQSLLVVLLDRSGSLIYQPGATDPEGYSTSVTKALADLWPGHMAVVAFSNDQTMVLGPAILSDQNQRGRLKEAVQNYPIGGDTPLAPALSKALALLKGAPSGSRAVIVTDGSPEPPVINGVSQVDDIRTHLVPQFCSQGVPVSSLGLALDLSSTDGQQADHLLRDIATGTSGTYTFVRSSQDLAQVVIKLYADWQHLMFAPVSKESNGSTYTVSIDTYAKRVTFVTFRSDSKYGITLNDPGGQPLLEQTVQRSTDRHYEIDNLVLSDVNQAGSYTISTSGDGAAQVYALVESRLHAVLNKPTLQTVAYIGVPLQIEAELYDENIPVVPKPNEATVNAHVSLLVHGQVISSSDVELIQGKDSSLFTRQIKLPGPIGQVKIELIAVYHQVPVEASAAHATIPLQAALPPPTLACRDNLKCYTTQILFGIPAAVLVFLLLLWLLLKGPRGLLEQGGHIEDLRRMRRPLLRRLLRKSQLSSGELEVYGDFDFGGAKFDLVFGREVRVRVKSDGHHIKVKRGKSTEEIKTEDRSGSGLTGGDVLFVGTSTPATYMGEEEEIDDGVGN